MPEERSQVIDQAEKDDHRSHAQYEEETRRQTIRVYAGGNGDGDVDGQATAGRFRLQVDLARRRPIDEAKERCPTAQ